MTTALCFMLLTAALGPAVAGPLPPSGAAPADETAPDTTLVHVQALFRHGARTPTTPYPSDPYYNNTYMPYGLGHLTKHGRQMEYELGQYLRERYIGGPDGAAPTCGTALLAEEYSTGAVLVNTSAVERTQESVAAFFAGLWPPGESQAWSTDGSRLGDLWVPIPYHIIPADEDRAIAGTALCPSRDLETLRVYKDSALLKAAVDALGGTETFEYTKKRAGITDQQNAVLQLAVVYSALACQEDLNMTLPEWPRLVYPEPLRTVYHLFLTTYSYNLQLRQQNFGDLTAGILSAARQPEAHPKLLVYSGHDATITAAITIFQLEPQDAAGMGIPEFSACLLFELHRDASGTLGLQFFYRREAGGPLVRMIPKGCSAFCPLDALQAILEDAGELPIGRYKCDVPTHNGNQN